jgi:hypothetical protein
MKTLATLALTLAALAFVATDAQAFGRRCGGGRIFQRPTCCQPAPTCCNGTATTTQPTTGEIRYFPQYAPAGNNPTTTGSTHTTGAAPVPVSGCSNGTCTTTPRFQLFRRR